MKIQSYSLDDIRKKHLTMFLPFNLLSFRPRLKSSTNPIREKELTEYISELIVILDVEKSIGNITDSEHDDYLGMINLVAERVFRGQNHLLEEVLNMTKPVLILPSDLRREAERAKQLEKELAGKNAELANKDNALSEQYLEIETLRKQNEALRAELAGYK